MITRDAHAVWHRNLKQGEGTMRFGSFEGSYSFATRFENEAGTNPEELIGAAHAGCFSMALANTLDKAGHAPDSVETTAHVRLDPSQGAITRIDLDTTVTAPGLSDGEFQRLAEDAKRNCPVSKALAGVDIHLDATLAG
ncbi:MAG: OsmC family protein [Rhodothermales bacterium]|nr:OsmC family protein [Rhodothermales bacterium]